MSSTILLREGGVVAVYVDSHIPHDFDVWDGTPVHCGLLPEVRTGLCVFCKTRPATHDFGIEGNVCCSCY